MKTNNTQHPLWIFCILVLTLASCATPQTIVRMNPVSPDVRWNYGQAFAGDTVTGIMVECAFDNATKEYNVFDVSIVNGSNLPYLVDPVNFFIEESPQPTEGVLAHRAIDPETMILSVDKQKAQNEADKKNAQVKTGVALGLLTAAAVAVSLSGDVPLDPNLFISSSVVEDIAGNGVSPDYESSYDYLREMWVSSTIRKTTLEPNYRLEGKLFFPRFEKPGLYVFKLKVDEEYIEIPFNQINHTP